MIEDYEYLNKQENIYWDSDFLDFKWYRKIYGGKWIFVKFGRDTPYISMFCFWTKMPNKSFNGYIEVLDVEKYKYTGVDSKKKLYKGIIKSFFSFFKNKKES